MENKKRPRSAISRNEVLHRTRLEEKLKLDGGEKDVQSRLRLGRMLFDDGEYEKAAQILFDALELGLQSFRLLSALGISLFELGRFEEAGIVLERAVMIYDSNIDDFGSDVHHCLLRSLKQGNHHAKLLEMAEKASRAACDPRHRKATFTSENGRFGALGAIHVFVACHAFELLDFERVLLHLERAHKEKEHFYYPYTREDIWLMISLTYEMLGELDLAHKASSNAGATRYLGNRWYVLGTKHEKQQDLSGAIEALDQAIIRCPTNIAALKLQHECLQAVGYISRSIMLQLPAECSTSPKHKLNPQVHRKSKSVTSGDQNMKSAVFIRDQFESSQNEKKSKRKRASFHIPKRIVNMEGKSLEPQDANEVQEEKSEVSPAKSSKKHQMEAMRRLASSRSSVIFQTIPTVLSKVKKSVKEKEEKLSPKESLLVEKVKAIEQRRSMARLAVARQPSSRSLVSIKSFRNDQILRNGGSQNSEMGTIPKSASLRPFLRPPFVKQQSFPVKESDDDFIPPLRSTINSTRTKLLKNVKESTKAEDSELMAKLEEEYDEESVHSDVASVIDEDGTVINEDQPVDLIEEEQELTETVVHGVQDNGKEKPFKNIESVNHSQEVLEVENENEETKTSSSTIFEDPIRNEDRESSYEGRNSAEAEIPMQGKLNKKSASAEASGGETPIQRTPKQTIASAEALLALIQGEESEAKTRAITFVRPTSTSPTIPIQTGRSRKDPVESAKRLLQMLEDDTEYEEDESFSETSSPS